MCRHAAKCSREECAIFTEAPSRTAWACPHEAVIPVSHETGEEGSFTTPSVLDQPLPANICATLYPCGQLP